MRATAEPLATSLKPVRFLGYSLWALDVKVKYLVGEPFCSQKSEDATVSSTKI
jgi:hypothetical protein